MRRFFSPHAATAKPVNKGNPPAEECQLVLIISTSLALHGASPVGEFSQASCHQIYLANALIPKIYRYQ
jgi:hypothetical protein